MNMQKYIQKKLTTNTFPSAEKTSNTNTVANTTSVMKNTDIRDMRFKQFEDFRNGVLEKLKPEFMEVYSEGHKKRSENVTSLEDFALMSALGQGSFGCVVLAKHKASNKHYAIKVMNKLKIVKDKQLDHTLNEKRILCACNFPFLIHMEFCFRDNCNLFLALPFIPGGDMFSLMRRLRVFKERDAKFYAAQVILALEYFHYMDVLYRDLKPENIVVDANGYIKLTDFGFCKLVKTRTYTLCGTPEYLAPEIILSKGYGKSVDWWSFGVFLYEMIAGITPFYAEEAMAIYEKITIGKFRFTADFSPEARDLIRNILQLDLSRRYGILRNGVFDIKGHDWFKMVDWNAIYNRKATAPFVPKIESSGDASNFDHFHIPRLQQSEHEKFIKEFEDF